MQAENRQDSLLTVKSRRCTIILMSSSPTGSPAKKKVKADDGDDVDRDVVTSWRNKSIEKFGLQPVPDGWKDSVAVGSEEAWKRYYEYRSNAEDCDGEDSDYEDSSEDGGNSAFMREWKDNVSDRVSECMAEYTEWHWTPRFGDLVWEDYRELRSAEYYAHVWSPYEIPRAIELEHQYHYRTRYSSVEFSTVWSYRKIDFEEEGTINCEKYKTICSNCFEDPELRADVIKTSHMNKRTCKLLRELLYGSYSEESKHITCSDKNFWLLLFGSMGTTDPDLETDPMGGYEGSYLGYVWGHPYLDKDLRKELYSQKAEEDDDPEGDPNGPFDEYYPKGCSWLKHRLLEITKTLGPGQSKWQQRNWSFFSLIKLTLTFFMFPLIQYPSTINLQQSKMQPVTTTGMIMETKVTRRAFQRRTWKRCSTSFLLSIMGYRIQRKCE